MIARVMSAAAAMAAARQAVAAVRLAAVLDGRQQPLLAMVPTTSICGAPVNEDGVTVSAFERPEDYRLALDVAPPERLDTEYLALAWALGAWDVARTERQPLPAGAEPLDPRHGIAHLLHDPYEIRFRGQSVESMPCPVDARAWADAAAAHGWITWLCKPLLYGPAVRRGWISKDRTLRPDGGRDPRPRPWTAWAPVVRGADHQTLIRLGRAPHGNRGRRQA